MTAVLLLAARLQTMMLVSMLPEAMNCESGDHPMHMVRAVWKRKSCFCCRWKERESRRESGR